MIARTMKCHDCKKEILEKMTNEDYSEYLQKRKQAEKKEIEYGWFCKDCANEKCVMCKIGRVEKFIPVKKDGEIKWKAPTCQNCFDKFKKQLGFEEEIVPELLESLPSLDHGQWMEFMKSFNKEE